MSKSRVVFPYGRDILEAPHDEMITDYITRGQLVWSGTGGKCDQPVSSAFHTPDVFNQPTHILGMYPYNAEKQLYDRLWIGWLSARELVQPGLPSVDYTINSGLSWVTCTATHALPFALTPPYAGSLESNQGATVVDISGLSGFQWLACRQSQTNGTPGDHSSWIVTGILYNQAEHPF